MAEAPREGRVGAVEAYLIKQRGSEPASEQGFRRLGAQTGPQSGFRRVDQSPAPSRGFATIGQDNTSGEGHASDIIVPSGAASQGASAKEGDKTQEGPVETQQETGEEQLVSRTEASVGSSGALSVRSQEHVVTRTAFIHAKERATRKAAEEKRKVAKGERPWPVYISSVGCYEASSREVLDETLTSFLERRRAIKGKVFALDVMGAGDFSTAFPVDGQAAITLVDFRTQAQKDEDENRNRVVIEDDVLRNSPWLKAQRFLDEFDDTELKGFDLITCRPIGGWDVLLGEEDPEIRAQNGLLEWVPLQRMTSLLSPLGGMLLPQLPEGDHSGWLENVQQVDGLTAEGERGYFNIKRYTPRNVRLPKIENAHGPKLIAASPGSI